MQLMEVKMEEYKQLNFRANDVISDLKKYPSIEFSLQLDTK